MDPFAAIFERAKASCRSTADVVHLEESTKCAEWLCARESGDRAVIMPAILLHDIGWSRLTPDEQVFAYGSSMESAKANHRHEQEGAILARQILDELHYDPALTDEIVDIIAYHDTKRAPVSKNDAIVKDANVLSRYTVAGFGAACVRFDLTEERLAKVLHESVETVFFTKSARISARLHLSKRRLQSAQLLTGTNGLLDRLLETFLLLADRILLNAQNAVRTVSLESMRQRLMDLKRQVQVYIECHPEATLEELQQSRAFQDLAVQKFYSDGYTGIVDIGRQSPRYGQVIFHPDLRMVNQTMEELEAERPRDAAHGFWDWYLRAVDGEEVCSFYRSKDKFDNARDKVQLASPLRVGAMEWTVIATAYVDQSLHYANALASEVSNSIDVLLDDLDTHMLLPLARLIVASEVISAGDLSRRVEVDASNELGDLAGALNKMVESVETSNRQTRAYAEEVERQRDELSKSLDLIKEQQASIASLSVPVIRVWKHVLVLPLVGSIDAVRGQLILETILPRVVEEQAEHVFIDLTGVSVTGPEVVDALVSITKAISLLGATCTITGVSPRISRILVETQVELSGFQTAMNLEQALRRALGNRAR